MLNLGARNENAMKNDTFMRQACDECSL